MSYKSRLIYEQINDRVSRKWNPGPHQLAVMKLRSLSPLPVQHEKEFPIIAVVCCWQAGTPECDPIYKFYSLLSAAVWEGFCY